jgi:hypothetical protein
MLDALGPRLMTPVRRQHEAAKLHIRIVKQKPERPGF